MDVTKEQLIEGTLQAWGAKSTDQLPSSVRIKLEDALKRIDHINANGGFSSFSDAELARLHQQLGNANTALKASRKPSRIRRLWEKFLEYFGDSVRRNIK